MKHFFLSCSLSLLLTSCVGLSGPNRSVNVYAYNLGADQVGVRRVDGSIFVTTTPLYAEGVMYLPTGTLLKTRIPLSRSPFRVVSLISGSTWRNRDWLPATAVIMPDMRAAFFSMVTLPSDCGYPMSPSEGSYQNIPERQGDAKDVVPAKYRRPAIFPKKGAVD